jgi:hypothetical protein
VIDGNRHRQVDGPSADVEISPDMMVGGPMIFGWLNVGYPPELQGWSFGLNNSVSLCPAVAGFGYTAFHPPPDGY